MAGGVRAVVRVAPIRDVDFEEHFSALPMPPAHSVPIIKTKSSLSLGK